MPAKRGLLTALKETTFRSLGHRNYRRYFFGQIVSFVGSWMQSAALMWLLYDRTGDPRWPSWILVAQVGPTVLLAPWVGGLADRYPKRKLVFTTQSAFLLHAVVLTLLLAVNLAAPFVVLGFMVVSGLIQAVDLPAHNGWWGWHKNFDGEVAKYIKDHPDLTPEAFESWLHWRYAQPDLKARFPTGFRRR